MKPYEFLEHTADVKFRSYGETLEEAFKNAALAMKETMTSGIKVKEIKNRRISINARDDSSLLYNFLEEFLYLLDAKDFVVSDIKDVVIRDGKLGAMITGDKASLYKFSNDVKAVTYNDMIVEKDGDKFVCQVVLDV